MGLFDKWKQKKQKEKDEKRIEEPLSQTLMPANEYLSFELKKLAKEADLCFEENPLVNQIMELARKAEELSLGEDAVSKNIVTFLGVQITEATCYCREKEKETLLVILASIDKTLCDIQEPSDRNLFGNEEYITCRSELFTKEIRKGRLEGELAKEKKLLERIVAKAKQESSPSSMENLRMEMVAFQRKQKLFDEKLSIANQEIEIYQSKLKAFGSDAQEMGQEQSGSNDWLHQLFEENPLPELEEETEESKTEPSDDLLNELFD